MRGSAGPRVPFSEIRGRHIVVEEKLDGANSAVGFHKGRQTLQSRGHYLAGGPAERHFDLLKRWASARWGVLRETLGERYLMFGEWMYAKHTVFYDALPHYFMEFDIRLKGYPDYFLSTDERRRVLDGVPVVSVPVLAEGCFWSADELLELIAPSLYKTPSWRDHLDLQHECAGLRPRPEETDQSDLAEGLYIKVEEAGRVVQRYKIVREDFLKTAIGSGTHWLQRPIVPNMLADGADIFGGE